MEEEQTLEKFECEDCGSTSWVEDKSTFKCPNCKYQPRGD